MLSAMFMNFGGSGAAADDGGRDDAREPERADADESREDEFYYDEDGFGDDEEL